MSLLSPRLQLKVAQKQILTPGLVQMVTILQLNRLELKEMVTQEIVQNPVLEEATNEPGEEITPEELLPLLEAEQVHDPADKQLLEAAVLSDANSVDDASSGAAINGNLFPDAEELAAAQVVAENDTIAVNDPLAEPPAATDPFDEIDLGSFFDDYRARGKKGRGGEGVETPCLKPSLSARSAGGFSLRPQWGASINREGARD